MKVWIALLPVGAFLAGVAVFLAMFPYHPTVDLGLSSYLVSFLPVAGLLAAVGFIAWYTRRSRAAAFALGAAALVLAAFGLWLVEWDMHRVWDPLFHAPLLLGAAGCIAFALLWVRPAAGRPS